MQILLQPPRDEGDAWRAALAAALPDAAIAVWPDAPAEPDYALVWKPPRGIVRARAAREGDLQPRRRRRRAARACRRCRDGVPVIRLEDAGMAAQMAEYVTLAVLRAYREADAYAAQQREGRWQPRPRHREVRVRRRHPRLRRAGAGRRRARSRRFGFPLRGLEPRRARRSPGVESFAGRARAATPSSRRRACSSACCRRRRDTRGLLDRAALRALPRGAHVVNVARGDIVVDDDLVALLDRGHLAGATLDVFRDEPLPPAIRSGIIRGSR